MTKVVLFFSFNISLKKWNEMGILEREVILYNMLSAEQIKYSFITYGNKSDYNFQSKIPNVEILPLKDISCWPKLFNSLGRSNILKTNQISGALVPLIASIIFRKVFLVRADYDQYRLMLQNNRPLWKKWIVKIFSRIIYQAADRIVLTSEDTKKFVINNFRIKESKIHVHSNVVNEKKFIPIENIIKEQRVLFIGRLDIVKNLENLIRACNQLNIGLDIIGEGPEKNKLEFLANEIKSDVVFLGQIKNELLPQYINSHFIFALVSHSEGNPKVLIEAMSCGAVVLGSDIPGINTIINDGINGYLANRDAESISQKLTQILASNNEGQVGINARNYVLKNATFDSLAKFEREIYNFMQ